MPQVVSHLSELQFYAVRSGRLEIFDFGGSIPNDIWQFWGADLKEKCWCVDMMLERGDNTAWRYKRDPSFMLPREEAVKTSPTGIRYLAPWIVLFFKAKHCRAKDQQDFDCVAPRLTVEDRSKLVAWLEKFHPNHVWLTQLNKFSNK